jgi:hypothetical protein
MLNKNVLSIVQQVQGISNSAVISYPIMGIRDFDNSVSAQVDLSKFDKDSFEEFALYDKLSEFLNVIDLVENPEISQNSMVINIGNDNTNITYKTSTLDSVERFRASPDRFDRVKAVAADFTFVLSVDDMKRIRKASGVLKDLDQVSLSSSNGQISVSVDNAELGNAYKTKVPGNVVKDNSSSLSIDNFKRLPLGDYEVSLHDNGKGVQVFFFKSRSIESLEILISQKLNNR